MPDPRRGQQGDTPGFTSRQPARAIADRPPVERSPPTISGPVIDGPATRRPRLQALAEDLHPDPGRFPSRSRSPGDTLRRTGVHHAACGAGVSARAANHRPTASGQRKEPRVRTNRRAPSGWAVGGTVFAASILILIGSFQIIAGLAGIIDDDFYVVTRNYTFDLDTTAWGMDPSAPRPPACCDGLVLPPDTPGPARPGSCSRSSARSRTSSSSRTTRSGPSS